MVCRIGVSVVDPFSQVVLINIPRSTAMMLGYQASYLETCLFVTFFFPGFFFSIRPTDPISGNAFDAKRKKKRNSLIFIPAALFLPFRFKFSRSSFLSWFILTQAAQAPSVR